MAEKRCWIGTSWKMNKTLAEALAFAEALDASRFRHPAIQPFVIPPFTAVREVKAALADTGVKVGAQNMHWEDAGAWTGEVSPVMLKDCRLDLVELGHSERRAHFGETDETVGRKVAAALRHGLTPLICIGETPGRARGGQGGRGTGAADGGRAGLPRRQPARSPRSCSPTSRSGRSASAGFRPRPTMREERQARIREVAARLLPAAPPVLYGGSVNPGNCEDLIRRPAIDGLFIGRSAWNVEGYLGILDQCAAVIGG